MENSFALSLCVHPFLFTAVFLFVVLIWCLLKLCHFQGVFLRTELESSFLCHLTEDCSDHSSHI